MTRSRRFPSRPFFQAATLLLVGLASAAHAQAPVYTLTGLGFLGSARNGYGYSNAVALNNRGQVTGYSNVYDGNHQYRGSAPFLYTSGTLTNLGNFGTSTLGSSLGGGQAINSAGQVAGYSVVYDANHVMIGRDAFLYSGGVLTDLGNFGTPPAGGGSPYSTAVALNASGQVTGNSNVYDANHNALGQGAFLYSSGQLTDLGSLGTASNGYRFTIPAALNASGQVVGYSAVYDANHTPHSNDAFLYSNGQMTDLGNLGGTGYSSFSAAVAINDAGQIVGITDVRDSNNNYIGQDAFLYSNGKMTDLGNFGSAGSGRGQSNPVAINNAGQVAGYSGVYSTDQTYLGQDSFLYSNGKMTDLGNLGTNSSGQASSQPVALNASGQIIGTATAYDTDHTYIGSTPFLYSGGTLYNLSSLITGGVGWTGLSVTGINDFGQIVGNGTHNGNPEAFLLTPALPVLSFLAFASPVPGGTVVTATVTLNGPAPTDTVVGLSSSDSSVVRVHRAVIVPAGSSSATFSINTYRSHVTKTVTITATLGTVVQAQDLTISGR